MKDSVIKRRLAFLALVIPLIEAALLMNWDVFTSSVQTFTGLSHPEQIRWSFGVAVSWLWWAFSTRERLV